MDYLYIVLVLIIVGLGVWVFWLYKEKKQGGCECDQEEDKETLMERQAREKQANKKKILEFMEGKERIANDDVEQLLGVSDATAERYLDELEKEGLLRQVGRTGRHTYYKKT